MIRVIGLMTGNSLDAVDAVLTEFGPDGSMRDLAFSSLKSPADLVAKLRELRLILEKLDGQVELAEKAYNEKCGEGAAEKLHDEYLHFLCQAVNEIKLLVPGLKIDLIGMHGQTLAHAPRSMGLTNPYTVQLGSGQGLADLTGIPAIADFRSDDLFAGGEGAPLAPMHHLHLSKQLKAQGLFPVAFCNAGNSGNLSIVSTENYLGAWDTGPFNHYPDRLMQQDRGLLCDRDGLEGRQGQVNLEFLGQLFSESTRTKTGKNFFELPPPKSADPKWYKDISSHLNFADRLRTAEYFSS